MTDVASQRQEESGYGEVKGEAGGMEGSSRVKLIHCQMKKMKKSTVKNARASTIQRAARRAAQNTQ